MSTTAISSSDSVSATDSTTDMIIIPLNAHDRCDQCGSQAFVRFVKDEQDFLFCSHHARKHERALIDDHGYGIIQDERTSFS